jgi:hypothetical protein
MKRFKTCSKRWGEFNADQTIDGEPHLPGFRVAVKEIFE